MKKRKNSRSEDAQIYYAQTGSTLARALFAIVVAAIGFIPLWYLHAQYGPAAVTITVGALVLIFMVAALIMLGVSTSNRAQENFIEALGELKGVFAPVARENAKTLGVLDRANVKIAERERLGQMQVEQRQAPMIEDQQMRDAWISAVDVEEDVDTVNGEMYQIR